MAYGDPYCGNCHQWQTRIGQTNIWECDCTVSGQPADTTKDPNCHNSRHEHYDPESPIVLARQAEYAAEDKAYLFPGAEACGHPKVDGECTFWGCPSRVPLVDGTPFFDTIAELDEILEDTNEPVEMPLTTPGTFSGSVHGLPHHSHEGVEQTEVGALLLGRDCDVQGHVWVKYGKVGLTESGLSGMGWGPETCLRCGEPAPVEKDECVCSDGWVRDCPVHPMFEGGTMPEKGGEFVGPVIVSKGIQISPRRGEEPRPKHACPGCNLRDLTMKDAKEHLRKLLTTVNLVGVLQPGLPKRVGLQDVRDIRREAAAFLRMSENKIRAMEEGDWHAGD